jgi:hypothetical protein
MPPLLAVYEVFPDGHAVLLQDGLINTGVNTYLHQMHDQLRHNGIKCHFDGPHALVVEYTGYGLIHRIESRPMEN